MTTTNDAAVSTEGTKKAPPAVRLENVTKEFKGMVAVDDLTLELAAGEFFALLGPSGCGKTTTLRMVGGFEQPSSGKIFLGGEDITWTPPYRRDVNTVFQSYALFPHLSVFDNVAFGLRRKGKDKDDIKRLVEEHLEILGLGGFGPRPATQLSGGQQQMLAIGRALMGRPQLLLLDEPSLGLSPKLADEVLTAVKAIVRQGTAVLLAEQNVRKALACCDRAYVLKIGKVVLSGATSALRDNEEIRKAFLGA